MISWIWWPIRMALRIEGVGTLLWMLGGVAMRVLDAVLPPMQPVLVDDSDAAATASPPSKERVLKSNLSALRFMLGIHSCSKITLIVMAVVLGAAILTAAITFVSHVPAAWSQVMIQYGLDQGTNGVCEEGGGVRVDKQLNVICNAARDRMSTSYQISETWRRAFDATPFCFVSCIDFFETLTPLALRVLLIAASCAGLSTFAAWLFSGTAAERLRKKVS